MKLAELSYSKRLTGSLTHVLINYVEDVSLSFVNHYNMLS